MRVYIVIPACNAETTIGDTIRSLLAQHDADWRVIVVDDGSVDATADVTVGFADSRIRVLRQDHAGVSVARNRGFAQADADAVMFLDADDRLAPDALARLVRALHHAPHAVASTGAASFDAVPGSKPRRPLPAQSGECLGRLLWRNRFANGGHILARCAPLRAAGPFNPGLTFGEDWDMWVRLALQGPFIAAQGRDPVLYVRERPDGAYWRHVADADALRPCLDAIFGNPILAQRIGWRAHAKLRRRAEAEWAWIVGRAMMRDRNVASGLPWLLRSVAMAPSVVRIALLGILLASTLSHFGSDLT